MKALIPFFSHHNHSAKKVTKALRNGAFERAFAKRKDEIESLRAHDSGEKTIDAPSLESIVHSL